MEGYVNGRLDPKEGKEATYAEKKMSFDLVSEFMKKTQEELLQLADHMNQSDQKFCMLEKELLQIKDAIKVRDDKIDMMEDAILQLKANDKETDGKIEAVFEAIESLNHRLDEAVVEKTATTPNFKKSATTPNFKKSATTPNFKKLAIFVGVPILVALATKKLG